MPSLSHEIILAIIIVIVLQWAGIWPMVIRSLRELRGDHVEPQSYQNASPSSPPASRDGLDLSFKLLGISPSSSWPEIERAYRAKAKIHHPDRGGDDDTMRALNDAYERIKRACGR